MAHGSSAAAAEFLALPKRRRALVVACAAFTVLHFASTLLRGAPPSIRDALWPAFAWYGDGLHMASTWGMFAKTPRSRASTVFGVTPEGRRLELMHNVVSKRDLAERIVDARVRKFQARLEDEDDRGAWGRAYLEYFCRKLAARGTRLERVELEAQPRPDDEPREPQILLSAPCTAPSAPARTP